MEKGGGFFLQTPEFLRAKETKAQSIIGRYLLVAGLYEKGVAVGHRFKPRQNEPHQWLYRLGEGQLVAGWSEDWASFKALEGIIYNIEIGEEDLFGSEHSATLPSIFKKIARYLRSVSIESIPIPIDSLFVDAVVHKIVQVDFSGAINNRIGFGVLGGFPYQDPYTEEEMKIMEKAAMSGGLITSQDRATLEVISKNTFHAPLKEAVARLERTYQGKDFLGTKEEAVDAVKSALIECDPPSKSEEFELTVFENGELTSSYFKRDKKTGPAPAPAVPQPAAINVGFDLEFLPGSEKDDDPNDDDIPF